MQPQSLCLYASSAWADEAEKQLSRLAFSACELSVHFRIFGVGLMDAPGTDPQSYV